MLQSCTPLSFLSLISLISMDLRLCCLVLYLLS
jgi:hypothetical protein